jgi:hypothetical protein
MLIGLITCDTDSNTPADFRNYFIKYYGASGNQQGVDIVVNPDGTMLLLGNSQEFENDSHFFVVKIDSAGQILWERLFENGNGSNEFAVDIEPTIDGNYVIAAQKQISPTDVDVLLTKISPDGILTRFNMGGSNPNTGGFIGKLDSVKSVTPLKDGSYLVTGNTNNAKNETDGVLSDIEAFIFKCDNNFIFNYSIWNTTYGQAKETKGLKVFEKSANEFYIFSTSNALATSDQNKDFNFSFIPIDSSTAFTNQSGAKVISLPDYSSDINDETLASVSTRVGGFALLGTSESGVAARKKSVYTLIVGNVPTAGSIGKSLNISSDNYSGKAICKSDFGGFFGLADREVTIGNSLTKTIVLMRLDEQGELRWSNNFGSVFSTKGTALAELPNGKVVIVGTATLDNQEKMLLIKVNSEGRFLN